MSEFEQYARRKVFDKPADPRLLWIQTVDYSRDSIIRLYCLDTNGKPVTVKVAQFKPYFYVGLETNLTGNDISQLNAHLGFTDSTYAPRLSEDNGRESKDENSEYDSRPAKKYKREPPVTKIELTKGWNILDGFRLPDEPFKTVHKITLNAPSFVYKAIDWFHTRFGRKHCQLYECNVDYAMRYFVDHGITSCSWIRIDPNRDPTQTCFPNDVKPLDLTKEQAPPTPSMVMLSFDIECASALGNFPDATNVGHPVIQIGVVVHEFSAGMPVLARLLLSFGSCPEKTNDMPGNAPARIYSYKTEAELLAAWKDLIVAVDPDIITGYNVLKFDINYLLTRVETLGLDSSLLEWGRNGSGECMQLHKTTFESKAYGKSTIYEYRNTGGRTIIDMYDWYNRNKKLRSYTLNSVSTEFLGETKEDLPHGLIGPLWRGSDTDRQRLATYCLKDADLAMRHLIKQSVVYQSIETSLSSVIPMGWLYSKGQQVKVIYQIYACCRLPEFSSWRFLIPYFPPKDKDKLDDDPDDGECMEESYEGALVIEPKIGAYFGKKMMVITEDMKALYPSIMIAHNLSYDTLVPPHRLAYLRRRLGEDKIHQKLSGEYFVDKSIHVGILPFKLTKLATLRDDLKLQMKACKDPFENAVLDGRQLAAKLGQNSIYGFTGATVGRLPCVSIAKSVTGEGQGIIQSIRKLILDTCNVDYVKQAFGLDVEAALDVLYGDTDSVMILARCDLDTAFKLGKALEKYINTTLLQLKPLEIQYEKVYRNYILFGKKRYAGIYCISGKKPFLNAKGIEKVRRDFSPMTTRVQSMALDLMLGVLDPTGNFTPNPEGALTYIHEEISKLLTDKIDFSELIISKGYTKAAKDYHAKQPHIELAQRMARRDPVTAPVFGDRVPYVIIAGLAGDKNSTKSEDPYYAITNDLALDTLYYLEKHLEKPLVRMFKPLYGGDEDVARRKLFVGPHMLKKVVNTKPSPNGGLGKWIQVLHKCHLCKSSMKSATIVCEKCKNTDAARELQLETNVQFRQAQQARYNSWIKCMACANFKGLEADANDSTIPCSARDCDNFYKRFSTSKKLSTCQERHKALDW